MHENIVANFFIPMNTPSSKNNRRWTGKLFIASKSTMKWRKGTAGAWLQNRMKFKEALKGLPKPYYVEFTFIRNSTHKFDYVNISQAPLDAMTEYGWIDDDNSDNIVPYFGDYVYDKKNPGLIITILKTKPDHYGNQTFKGGDSPVQEHRCPESDPNQGTDKEWY